MTRPYCEVHVDEARRIVDFGVKSFVGAAVVLLVHLVSTVIVAEAAVNGGVPLWVVLGWAAGAVAVHVVGQVLWRRSVRRSVSHRIDLLAMKVLDCADCDRARIEAELPPAVVREEDAGAAARVEHAIDRNERTSHA